MLNDDTLAGYADKYGTCTYIFDTEEAIGRLKEIRKILDDKSKDRIGLCYSIKANPFLIPSLLEEKAVDHFEVCSPGELSICEKYHVPGEMIIYSGVHKEEEDTLKAISLNAGIITAESLRHYELIKKGALTAGKKPNVILRLSSKNQFGMSKEDIITILTENKENNDPVDIVGIHYFAGTQRPKLKHRKEELEMLKDFFVELKDRFGEGINMLEYGPGLPYPYFENDDRSDTLLPLKDMKELLDETSAFSQLTIEMGRFIASSCGYYLTRVCDVKRTDDKNWCIVDGGINHLNYLGSMMGMMVPVISHISKEKDDYEPDEWAVCGSLCTTNDVLVRSFKTTTIHPGDLLIFKNAGAYSVTEAMALFLSRDLPLVVTVGKNGEKILRDRLSSWEFNS